ncbi:MAG: hypothetical protein JXR36_15705 [Bacteroidales bacterium]|nr:hypothetical protein [Bacteroidales bacterium]
MRTKALIVILSMLFLLSSCKPIMYKLYGIKKPDVETEQSIKDKALKFGLDTSNIVTVNEYDFLQVMKGQGIPDGEIFDKNGHYINYRQTDSACNAGLFEFIPNLKTDTTFITNDSILLINKMNKFKDFNGKPLQEIDEAEFYLLIYWTVWTGKLNKDHVKIWEDLALENQNCKIQVIKINLDMQDYWDKEELKPIYEAMRKGK